jgi:hypothetical protein
MDTYQEIAALKTSKDKYLQLFSRLESLNYIIEGDLYSKFQKYQKELLSPQPAK